MRPLYIFDLDGTLANIEHRRHLVQRGEKPDWPEFYRQCVNDEPVWPVINTLVALARHGSDVWIWSGRSAEVMNETRSWLQRYVPSDELDEIELCMRRVGDYTPDEQLKAAWYDNLCQFDKRRLVAIFDDRQKVVDMWRSKGIACFQVAPGDF